MTTRRDIARIHTLTKVIAHTYDRPMAPVGSYILGLAVGAAAARGESADVAALQRHGYGNGERFPVMIYEAPLLALADSARMLQLTASELMARGVAALAEDPTPSPTPARTPTADSSRSPPRGWGGAAAPTCSPASSTTSPTSPRPPSG